MPHKINPSFQEKQIYSLWMMGFISESGDILTDEVKAKLKKKINDDNKVSEILKKCAVQEDTSEATSFNLMECLSTGTP